MTFLRGEGCLQVQGYLFGKPQPLSDIKTAVMTAIKPVPTTSNEDIVDFPTATAA